MQGSSYLSYHYSEQPAKIPHMQGSQMCSLGEGEVTSVTVPVHPLISGISERKKKETQAAIYPT